MSETKIIEFGVARLGDIISHKIASEKHFSIPEHDISEIVIGIDTDTIWFSDFPRKALARCVVYGIIDRIYMKSYNEQTKVLKLAYVISTKYVEAVRTRVALNLL